MVSGRRASSLHGLLFGCLSSMGVQRPTFGGKRAVKPNREIRVEVWCAGPREWQV